jgi:hypothetical protein
MQEVAVRDDNARIYFYGNDRTDRCICVHSKGARVANLILGLALFFGGLVTGSGFLVYIGIIVILVSVGSSICAIGYNERAEIRNRNPFEGPRIHYGNNVQTAQPTYAIPTTASFEIQNNNSNQPTVTQQNKDGSYSPIVAQAFIDNRYGNEYDLEEQQFQRVLQASAVEVESSRGGTYANAATRGAVSVTTAEPL